MTKILKTSINTSLLMLFVGHSYGLVYNLSDVNNRAGISNDPGMIILDNTTHSQFNGIDDTFDGSITFNFSITYDIYPSGGSFSVFHLESNAGIAPIAIGNTWTSDNWGAYRINGLITEFAIGSNAVVEGQSQAFTMTIDYNAGALDSATLIMAGDSTAYDIGDYDYSFDRIKFRNGLDNNVSSATNMSVSIVPEPATYALLSGAFAFVFVAFRRRLKA